MINQLTDLFVEKNKKNNSLKTFFCSRVLCIIFYSSALKSEWN